MNRFLLRSRSALLAVLLLSSLVASLFTTSQVNAASAFDNAYQNTPQLVAQTDWPSWFVCAPFDYSTTWASFVTDNTTIYNTNPTKQSNFALNKTSFENAVANGGTWGVSRYGSVSGSEYMIDFVIFWTEDTTTTLDFTAPSGRQRVTLNATNIKLQYVNYVIPYGGSGCAMGVPSVSTSAVSSFIISNQFGSDVTQPSTPELPQDNFFVTGSVINYPPGYNGQLVVESPPLSEPNIYPKFGYNVGSSGQLSALIYQREDISSLCSNYGVHWTLTDSSNNIVSEKFTNEIDTFNYTFTGYDDYILKVEYYAGIPCAPLPDNYIPSQVGIVVNGEISIGSTNINDCTVVSGVYVCDADPPLDDCTTFGTDIGGYFNCIIGNFGTFLRSTLIDLFVPKNSFLTGYSSSLQVDMNTNLGGVYQSIEFLTGFIGTIITNGATGTCVFDPPGTLFGAEVEFDMCIFEDNWSVIWTAMQTLVVAGTSIILIIALVRKYQEVVDKR